jgi:hypothetical protein
VKIQSFLGLRSALRFVFAILGVGILAGFPSLSWAQNGAVDVGDSILNRLLAEHRSLPVAFAFAPGDKLAAYTDECQRAAGITMPATFNCADGVEVPGQGSVPRGTACDNPNVLNQVCDPGSRFQVLPGRSADAVAVAHCRKNGQTKAGSLYNDIAIILHNKANGAVCFFQALDVGMPGDGIPSPAVGDDAKWADGTAHWMSPAETHGTACTSCHDSGGFIRSNYIAQLRTPPNAMPNGADGFSNLISPLSYVGENFASDHSWSIETAKDPNDTGSSCATCHRLAVNDFGGGGRGTAMDFALRATAATQTSKNPHGPASPIWMRPGQVLYQAAAEATAKRFHDCAAGFIASGFATPPGGCAIKPLGSAWVPPERPMSNIAPIVEYYLNQ